LHAKENVLYCAVENKRENIRAGETSTVWANVGLSQQQQWLTDTNERFAFHVEAARGRVDLADWSSKMIDCRRLNEPKHQSSHRAAVRCAAGALTIS